MIHAQAPLHAANCRFLATVPQFGIWTNSTLKVTNCEINASTTSSVTICDNNSRTQAHIENCLIVGHINVDGFGYPLSSSLTLKRNTLIASEPAKPLLYTFRHFDEDGQPHPLLEIVASQNIMDPVEELVCFADTSDPKGSNEAKVLERALAGLLIWHEDNNIYREGASYLRVCRYSQALIAVDQSLASWQERWQINESGSDEGQIRYQVGDLRAKAYASPEKLVPQDFRLREGSAGYRAGPDGKDLGAEVDLVGPGEAYERWKKTPEYQAWRKESGQNIEPSP
jgi:hypothetical protein